MYSKLSTTGVLWDLLGLALRTQAEQSRIEQHLFAIASTWISMGR